MTSEQDKKGLAEVLSDNAERILVGVLALALLSALIVGFAYFALFLGPPLSIEPATLGQAGDYFGGILNPIFGFLSVFALLVALVLQTRELKLSRESLKLSQEELRLSREEQAKAAEALALQNKAIQQQSFEQTFFSMLRLLSDLLAGVVFKDAPQDIVPSQPIKGRSALRSITNTLRVQAERGDITGTYPEFVGKTIGSILRSSPQFRGLSEYARTLTTVLDYLYAARVGPGDIYPRLLRSQMGQEEVLFVYFLCFAEGWEGMKQSVERYGLLANIDPAGTGVKSDYFSFFDSLAFRGY